VKAFVGGQAEGLCHAGVDRVRQGGAVGAQKFGGAVNLDLGHGVLLSDLLAKNSGEPGLVQPFFSDGDHGVVELSAIQKGSLSF
jgi:hypothetical protein